MFAMLTESYKDLHSQGKLYGLIESGDNISFVFAFFIDKIFIHLRTRDLFIFMSSFLIFILGIIVSSKFKGSNKLYGKIIDQKC
jgi:hypothetical protein